MASWDAPYDKYRIKKLSRLTKDTTEEEIKDLYKNWATTYDKVLYSRLLDPETVREKLNPTNYLTKFRLTLISRRSGCRNAKKRSFSYYIVTLFERSHT